MSLALASRVVFSLMRKRVGLEERSQAKISDMGYRPLNLSRPQAQMGFMLDFSSNFGRLSKIQFVVKLKSSLPRVLSQNT